VGLYCNPGVLCLSLVIGDIVGIKQNTISIGSTKEEQSGGTVDGPFMLCTLNVM
jgi:hypothetical protein